MEEFDAPSIKSILEIRREIRGGKFHPDADSIRVFHAFLRDSFDLDVKATCSRAMKKLDAAEDLAVFSRLSFERSVTNLLAAKSILEGDVEMSRRIDVYLAFLGEPAAQVRELRRALQRDDSAVEQTRAIEFALGCIGVIENGPDLALDLIIETGRKCLRGIADLIADGGKQKAGDFFEAMAKAAAADDPFAPSSEPPKLKHLQIVSDAVIVVPPFAAPKAANKSDRHRVRADFHVIAGQALSLVKTGKVLDHMSSLSGRAPHLADVYARLMTDTGQSPYARFSPTILVGEPGSGKSWSAREIGRVMSLPVSVFSCGGVVDGTFGGTAAHWSTSGTSMPLGFILQCRKANPLIVLDEIEKAGTGDQNGRLVDVLLSFLDRGNAGAYRDPALEMAVDLSHVSYLLTANSLEGIPPPLRDRCRIIMVPNPSPEHVPVLVSGIIDDIATERGIDRRWFEPLAADELDVVIEGWGRGSIRRLRRVVETFLDGRDRARGVY